MNGTKHLEKITVKNVVKVHTFREGHKNLTKTLSQSYKVKKVWRFRQIVEAFSKYVGRYMDFQEYQKYIGTYVVNLRKTALTHSETTY